MVAERQASHQLTRQWQDDHAAFQDRDLTDRHFVHVWADVVRPKVRLGQTHSCVLVLLGVPLDGTKELIAPAEGLREPTESWPTCCATAAASAQERWPAITGASLVTLVRSGAKFKNGILAEREGGAAA